MRAILIALAVLLFIAPVALADTTVAYPESGQSGDAADGILLWAGGPESFANLIPWSGTVDGFAVYDDGTAFGAANQVLVGIQHDGSSGFVYAYFPGMCFDTSAVPADATIDSVSLRLYTIGSIGKGDALEMGSGADVHVVAFDPADPGTFATGDYDAIPSGTSLGEITYANWTTGNRSVSLPTSAVIKNGITCLALVLEDMVDGSYGGRTDVVDGITYLYLRSAEFTDTGSDPELTTTWHLPATARPGAQAGAPF